MDLLTYSLLLIASFLGLSIGIILSNMAVEEITRVSKYLKYLNIFLVPLIIFMAVYSISILYAIIFASIALLLLIIFRNRYPYSLTYACMGALMYISTLGKNSLDTAIIISVYGLSIATIEASRHFKNRLNGQIKSSENISLMKKILSKYFYYLLVGIIFYVVFSIVI